MRNTGDHVSASGVPFDIRHLEVIGRVHHQEVMGVHKLKGPTTVGSKTGQNNELTAWGPEQMVAGALLEFLQENRGLTCPDLVERDVYVRIFTMNNAELVAYWFPGEGLNGFFVFYTIDWNLEKY